MRSRTALAAVACLALPVLAAARDPELRLPSFENLQHKATQVVDITIGEMPLHIARWFVGDDPEAKELIKGLKSVRVRSFEFDADDMYSTSDIDAIRSQLSGPDWSRLVQTRDRNTNENTDIYLAVNGAKITGLAIISSEPRKFSIINIVGSIRPEQLAKLQKPLGLPDSGTALLAHDSD